MSANEHSPLISQTDDGITDVKNQNEETDTALNSQRDAKPPVQDRAEGIKPSIWRDTTWTQKAMILYIMLVNFLNYLCNGTSSPFLARVVLQKGGNMMTSTFVMEISMVTMAISSLVIAKYQSRIGCRKLIIYGQVLFALCQVGSGATGYFNNQWGLVLVGSALRGIQGVCQAGFLVAGLTVVCQEFPDFVSTVFGIFEASYGAGYLSGPYLGGFLYDESGGMMLPMAVTGLVTLLFSVLGIRLLKKADDYKSQSGTYSYVKKILTDPRAVLIIGTSATVASGFSLCDATITVYLQSLGYSVTKAGQLLFLMGVSYCLSSFAIGWLITVRKTFSRLTMMIGILGALGLPFLFSSNQTDPWVYAAAFGFAMCAAFAFIPALDELLNVIEPPCKDAGLERDMSLNSAVSGLWSTTVALGNFVGPLIGSGFEMVLPFSFSFSFTILAGYILTFLFAAIAVLYQQVLNRKQ